MISEPVLINNNNNDRGFYVGGGKVVGICDYWVQNIIVFLWLKLDVLR